MPVLELQHTAAYAMARPILPSKLGDPTAADLHVACSVQQAAQRLTQSAFQTFSMVWPAGHCRVPAHSGVQAAREMGGHPNGDGPTSGAMKCRTQHEPRICAHLSQSCQRGLTSQARNCLGGRVDGEAGAARLPYSCRQGAGRRMCGCGAEQRGAAGGRHLQ